MIRALGTLLSRDISYLVFIDPCILREMRTADVSKMCFHPHAGEGLLCWPMLFNCSRGLPGTLAGWVFPAEWLAKLLVQEDVEQQRQRWRTYSPVFRSSRFPDTSIWVSKAADQISSWGHAVLGSGWGEIGCWSEQLGDMARIGDGRARTIEPLIQSLSQPSVPSRSGSIRSQRMLRVPVVAQNTWCLPTFFHFWKLQTCAEREGLINDPSLHAEGLSAILISQANWVVGAGTRRLAR